MSMLGTRTDLFNLGIPVEQIKAAITAGGSTAAQQTTARNAIATKPAIAALTPSSVANGSDAATTQALANDLKTKVNAIIAALKA